MPPVNAPLFREFQRASGRSAPLRADVPCVPRFARGRNPSRDGQPRICRAGVDWRNRQGKGRGRRHHRREELLHRNGGGRGESRARLPEARARRTTVPRAGLRPEPDRALGGETEIEKHGGGGEAGAGKVEALEGMNGRLRSSSRREEAHFKLGMRNSDFGISQSLVTSAATESEDLNGLLMSLGRRESGRV